MDKRFDNIYKILVSAIIIIAVVISVASTLLYNKANDFAMDIYADSAGKNSVTMANKLFDTEQELKNFSYRMLTEDRNIMLVASTDVSVTNDQLFQVDLSLSRAADSYGVSAMVFYRTAGNKITHRYYKKDMEFSDTDIKNILEKNSDKIGYCSVKNGEDEDMILYVSPMFNGCKVVYRIDDEYLNALYGAEFDSKYSNIYFYKDNEYLFANTHSEKTKQNIDDYKFGENKNYYVENNKLYILNYYYDYSAVSEINMQVFSVWKNSIFSAVYLIAGAILILLLLALSILYFFSAKSFSSFADILESKSKSHEDFSVKNSIQLAFMGDEQSELELETLFGYLKKYKYYSCCCMKIDSKGVNDLILKDGMGYLLRLCTARLAGYNVSIVKYGKVRIGFVFVGNYKMEEKELTGLFSEIKDEFYKQFGQTATVVINASAQRLEEFVSACQSADYMLAYRFFYGNNSTIIPNEISIKNGAYPIELEQEIIDALNKNDEGVYITLFDKFFIKLIEEVCPSVAKRWLLNLIFSILRYSTAVKEKQVSDFISIVDGINNSETISECIENIRELLPDILFFDSNPRESVFMRNVQSIVKSEFANPDLNVSYIAEKLGMTSAYFGQKFLKETDILFNVYLADYRISYAKELLITTKLKVEDIAMRCGFSNMSYFIKVFKQNTSITPSGYRKKYTSQ